MDLIRSDINRLYHGFNRDCGEGGALLAKPDISRPSNSQNFIRLSVGEEKGDGFWDVLRIQEGLLLCVANGNYADTFNYSVAPAADIISLRVVLSGDLEVNSSAQPGISIHRGAASLLRAPFLGDHEVTVDADAPLSSVTLHFHAERFAEIVGLNEDDAPPELTSVFAEGNDLQFWSMPVTANLAKTAHDLVRSPFTGVLRRRYFEAKALEIICHFMLAAQDSLCSAVTGDKKTTKNLAAIKEAGNLLQSNIASAPTVDELARIVGMNRTQLRREFKQVFGQTISTYLTTCRMQTAWSLLVEGNHSVRAVSDAVGYRHPGNFAVAFQRYYGIPPRMVK